jgi:hypothetical protein
LLVEERVMLQQLVDKVEQVEVDLQEILELQTLGVVVEEYPLALVVEDLELL